MDICIIVGITVEYKNQIPANNHILGLSENRIPNSHGLAVYQFIIASPQNCQSGVMLIMQKMINQENMILPKIRVFPHL